MKMKYYLRGVGVGFIVSSLIFMIAFLFYKPSLSKEEVASQAKRLGLTVTESSQNQSDTKKNNDSEKDQSQSDKKDAPESTGTTDENVPDQENSDGNSTDNTGDENTIVTENPDGSTTTTTEVPPEEVEKNNLRVSVTVRPGASDSLAIANDLASQGIVDDGKKFDDFMNKNGYSRRIQPGTFEFHEGMSYDEVANVLTKRK